MRWPKFTLEYPPPPRGLQSWRSYVETNLYPPWIPLVDLVEQRIWSPYCRQCFGFFSLVDLTISKHSCTTQTKYFPTCNHKLLILGFRESQKSDYRIWLRTDFVGIYPSLVTRPMTSAYFRGIPRILEQSQKAQWSQPSSLFLIAFSLLPGISWNVMRTLCGPVSESLLSKNDSFRLFLLMIIRSVEYNFVHRFNSGGMVLPRMIPWSSFRKILLYFSFTHQHSITLITIQRLAAANDALL